MNSKMKHKHVFAVSTTALLLMACAPEMKTNSFNPNAGTSEMHSVSEGTDFVQRDADTNEILHIAEPGAADFKIHQKYTYLTGTPRKWSGTISWYYNPAGQPSFFNTAEVVDRLIAATRQWEAASGVRFQYQGQTNLAANFSSCDRNTVVGWAALSNSTVGYTQACFSSSTFTEFDMQLDNRSGSFVSTLSRIQQVAVHEYGHAIGLGHTDINPAVMTAMLSSMNLVQDDIDGARSLYGAPTSPVSATPTPTPTPVSTPIPTPTPSPTPTPTPSTASWIYCASENQSCSFSGTRKVRYGANGSYVTKVVTGSVACNNGTFGDPAYGVAKQCHYSSVLEPAPTTTAVYSVCAQEGQYCSFSGTQKVRYGANGVYATKIVTGGISCTNAVFGDPIPGVVKRCEVTPTL